MTFLEKLSRRWNDYNSLLCVGLDPEFSKLPEHLKSAQYPIFEFSKEIIEATCDLVCAYKPQIAFYAAARAEDQLEMTVNYIRQHHGDIPVILDSKRGDIGNTARMYASEAFDRYSCDAVTVNPYLGGDSLEPYLERRDRAAVILCRTSNPGARDIQDLKVNGEPIYRLVAKKAACEWNYNGNVCLVVGATYPQELKEIRAIAKEIPFLVPGIGAQGGSVEAAVTNGLDSRGVGLIINSSRAIIFASCEKDFAQAAKKAAMQTRDEINKARAITHAVGDCLN